MEKRFVLFFVLSFVVIILYPFLLNRMGVVSPPPPLEAPAGQEPEAAPAGGISPAEPDVPADLPDAEDRRITVETSLYRAELSTRGAKIVRWELKKYAGTGEREGEPIVLYSDTGSGTPAVAVETGDASRDEKLRNAVFRVQGGDLRLDADHPTGTLSFILSDPAAGGYVGKTLTFSNETYRVGVQLDVRGTEQPYQVFSGTNFGIVEWAHARTVGFIGPLVMDADDVEKYKPGKIEGVVRHPEPPRWAALEDKYFIAALVPEGASTAIVREADDRTIDVGLEFPAGTPAVMSLYAGPKEFGRLSAIGVGLENSIEFGWFMFGSWWLVRAIAQPLFHFLQFLNGFTHNYGICIILLTVVVRSLFIPLMHKSYKSMKAMKALQPEMAALQKKYKNDKEKLNRELMELYKKHGANPLGGCLPMFLQLPVFIALYNVLNSTIELRLAPFLWVADLSSKDPFYVLPVIMGATMLVQQKMQPTTMDPRQAKMFMFLPVFFTILFLNFPAGLVLYWMTNNLLTILQQFVTMKYIDPEPKEAA